jgi:GGDEF domain-containing protein
VWSEPFQRLIADAVAGEGYAHAEGGDEVIIRCPNLSPRNARALAHGLVEAVRWTEFRVGDVPARLTIFAGIASGVRLEDVQVLPERANVAYHFSKDQGRDCASFWTAGEPTLARSRAVRLEGDT